MENIRLLIPYGIVFKNDKLVDELGLNPWLLNEGLREPEDLCTIEITEDRLWILKWITNYLLPNND